MIELPDGFRYANSGDRSILPEFIVLASHGASLTLWSEKAPEGVKPRSFGEDLHVARAERGEVILYDPGDGPLALLTSVPVMELEQPGPNESPLVIPLIELRNMAVPSWNILFLATLPEARRKGLGHKMLKIADNLAVDEGMNMISLIVAEGNQGAIRVYQSAGYSEIARKPMHRPGIDNPGNNWLLMTRNL